MSLLKTFNNHFLDFVKDIRSIFPEDKDVRRAETALEMMIKANPRMLIMLWQSKILFKYRGKIESGDMSFFVDKDYTEDLNNDASSQKIVEAIERLRQPVNNMSMENKEKSMKYIQNLSKLCDLYFKNA